MKNMLYQLDSVTNIQMNSYIITTAAGGVLVIDGGYREDTDNLLTMLRKIAGQTTPRVDAWILTHAHLDHVDCFLEIMEYHRDALDVAKIMYNFPSIQYCERERPWGGYAPTLDQFMALLPTFADRVMTLYGGDVYDIAGAHMEVLYSPNCEIQTNYINNSSVIFKLTVGDTRVLFTGDAGVEEGEKCRVYWEGTDALRADYVQMAHHGQGGADRAFYEAVRPRGCLWGTPDWLWNNDAGKGYNTHIWKTLEVRTWMDELGASEHYVMKDGVQTVEL